MSCQGRYRLLTDSRDLTAVCQDVDVADSFPPSFWVTVSPIQYHVGKVKAEAAKNYYDFLRGCRYNMN